MGYSQNQRLLLVVHTDRGDKTRIISARLVTNSERGASQCMQKDLAIRNRAPVATTGGTPATHWLGYTGEVHLRGLILACESANLCGISHLAGEVHLRGLILACGKPPRSVYVCVAPPF
ncbi:MAG: hypothetical protein ACREPR_16130 [Brasilonema sp.]